MKQIKLEDIIHLLPATSDEIAQHFPDISSRGIRNKLNDWIAEGKLFAGKRKIDRGRPKLEYTLEKPMESVETNIKSEGIFEGFVILELLGHRKLGGHIKETTLFGTKFIRFDTFTETGEVGATQFYNPTAVYCITPVTKEVAIAFGLRNQPAPVQQWELAKPQLTVIAGTPDEFHADYSDYNDGFDEDDDDRHQG